MRISLARSRAKRRGAASHARGAPDQSVSRSVAAAARAPGEVQRDHEGLRRSDREVRVRGAGGADGHAVELRADVAEVMLVQQVDRVELDVAASQPDRAKVEADVHID